MAKLVRIHETDAPSVMHIETAEIGAPGAHQVRVVQEAVGINYVDVLVRKGLYPMPLPTTLGFEAAGTVGEVGAGVQDFAPGDRVGYFFAPGAYASENLVPAASLIRLPDDVTFKTAATFMAKGLTAWMGLRALHSLTAGDKVLVLGASGSVGSILSRWAKHLGATVIGVAGSPDKLAKVANGADHALLASDPDIQEKIREIAPRGVDVVYDFVGQATFAVGVAAVRDGGTFAAIGAVTGQPPHASSNLDRRGVQVRGGGTPQYVRGATLPVATAELWDAIRSGVFADLEAVRYPFAEIVRLHTDLESRRLNAIPVLIVRAG